MSRSEMPCTVVPCYPWPSNYDGPCKLMPEKEQENERFPRILMSPQMKAFEVISYLKISKKKNEHNSEKKKKSWRFRLSSWIQVLSYKDHQGLGFLLALRRQLSLLWAEQISSRLQGVGASCVITRRTLAWQPYHTGGQVGACNPSGNTPHWCGPEPLRFMGTRFPLTVHEMWFS